MGTGTESGRKALIIGSGIGGLCAAIALQNLGWQPSVFEKSAALTEGGAGIVLAANAINVLHKLGLTDQIRAQGKPVGKAEIRTWNGKLLLALPTRIQAERYGTHSYLIHRAKLQSVLYERLVRESTVQFHKKLVTYEQNRHKVTAVFDDGTHEEGDVLIGADGLHSTVREALFGVTPLCYSGFTALRGIAVFNDERYPIEAGGGFEAWGPGKRFGFSHLGHGRIFWFAAINSPQGQQIAPGERKQTALGHFRGWFEPIEAVIEATEEASILAHDIFDRKPLAKWSEGRVALLGDAAHPMLPNLGQGGAQAMEDALVLSHCLGGTAADIPAALLAYEQRRIPRTTAIVRQSRRMGKLMQLENPVGIAFRNFILRSVPAGMQIERLHWLLGYEV